jgi:trk system potassium uptake protein
VADVDVAVVSIGENIESSLLVVMQLRELGVETVVAKAVTPLHGRILEKLGVSRVIFPEREMAIRVAHSLVMPNVLDYIELSRDFSIVEVPAPPSFVGPDAAAAGAPAAAGADADCHQAAGGPGRPRVITNIAPTADETIQEGDVLALLGWCSGC